MIAHKGQKRPTALERIRIDAMMKFGCVVCAWFFGQRNTEHTECHHIVRGNKRLGHTYSIPLCRGHHRGDWTGWIGKHVSIADGRKAFEAEYCCTELDIWQTLQRQMGMDATLPPSKIYKPEAPLSEALQITTTGE